MYKKMNSTQKTIFKIIVPFLLFAIIFMVCFNTCKNTEEEVNTTKTSSTKKSTEEFFIPEIKDEIPAVDDTYVIETQKNDDIYTFNYETRSPDEIKYIQPQYGILDKNNPNFVETYSYSDTNKEVITTKYYNSNISKDDFIITVPAATVEILPETKPSTTTGMNF